MRWAAAATVVIAFASIRPLAAQPGTTPTYSYRTSLLSEEERDLLARGEIGPGEHIAGGLVGTVVGFGLGHAIQRRFLERGWIFAAGDAVATGMLVKYGVECARATGTESCDDHDDWLAAGLLVAIGFRIWQIADVWYGPSQHNDRVREIRWRHGVSPVGLLLGPAPGGGGTAGITLRF